MDKEILSLGQDIIYNVYRGQIKTPKHVALPIAVKHITENSELVTMLNYLSHTMSETQGKGYETAIAHA